MVEYGGVVPTRPGMGGLLVPNVSRLTQGVWIQSLAVGARAAGDADGWSCADSRRGAAR
jgi:hypothetical protein